MTIVRYEFEQVPIDYIRSVLTEGSRLAHTLLRRDDLAFGKVHTCLPPGISRQDLWEFDAGFKVPPPPDVPIIRRDGFVAVPIGTTIDTHLVPWIREFLSSAPYGIALFEDPLDRPNDPWLRDRRVRRLLKVPEGDSYHYLIWEDLDPVVVRKTIREGYSIYPPLIGVLLEVSPEEAEGWRTLRRQCEPAEVEAIAFRAHTIILGAYDGEGFIVWEAPS